MKSKIDPSPQLEVGIASADMTPPLGIILAGYRDRLAASVGHRLRAEVMVCRSGKDRWALVIGETVGFSSRFTRDLRRDVQRRTGIPGEHVLLTATHTHSGPSTHKATYPRGSKEAAYGRKLRKLFADLAVKADKQAAPATFETAMLNAPRWGHNRRIKQADGTWTNDWQDPKLRHPGYFDPAILLVGVRRPNGRLDGLFVNYGSHPVTLGPRSLAISGDYVSYLKEALEQKKVAKTVMFGISGHANINPPECIQKVARYPRTMGKALAKLIIKAIPRLRPLRSGPVATALVPWKLRLARKRPEGKGMNWQSKDGFIRTQLMGLRAGDLGFVSVPGELFSEYVKHFRDHSPYSATVVLSLSNDYVGYFPTDQAQREGAYEVRMAPGRNLEKPLKRLARQALVQCSKPTSRSKASAA